jgi:hypothetical protein
MLIHEMVRRLREGMENAYGNQGRKLWTSKLCFVPSCDVKNVNETSSTQSEQEQLQEASADGAHAPRTRGSGRDDFTALGKLVFVDSSVLESGMIQGEDELS